MKHSVITDLAFGDSGKGSLTDYLCDTRGYGLVVRYSGGAQAGHRVVRADGREHVFRQFGAGTFMGAHTALSRYMMVDPLALAREADQLEALGIDDPLRLIHVSEDALVTTPLHAEANRREEIRRGDMRHGSCGRGIGKTREYARDYPRDALHVRDLRDPLVTRQKLELMCGQLTDWDLGKFVQPIKDYTDAFKRFTQSVHVSTDREMIAAIGSAPAVFEGSQGVLLDESWGFPPYYTWTDTTPAKALLLLSEAGVPRTDVTVYGLTRSYATRHGAGPFPTESPSPGMTLDLPDPTNPFNPWQGHWRVGRLDLPLLTYALEACGGEVDQLVVSCLDRVEEEMVCVAYEEDSQIPRGDTNFLAYANPVYTSVQPVLNVLEDYLAVPVGITSYGPAAADKKER